MWQSSTPAAAVPSPEDERAEEIRAKCGRFRILVIGRANAGKTTILQRTCNTTDAPVIYSANGEKVDPAILEGTASRGLHDIENEMVFESNPGFCFHDSRGFESGGVDELTKVKVFIENRSKEKDLSKQLHAIWYCVPVDDSRPFTTAEEQFFSQCGTGSVPVILIFTKFDALDNKAFKALRTEGLSRKEAKDGAPQRAIADFEATHLEIFRKQPYPPKRYAYLRDMNQEKSDCGELMEQTAAALDNEVLQQLFVSTQRIKLELCIEYGVKRGIVVFKANSGTWVQAINMVKEDEFKFMVSFILSWYPQYQGMALEEFEFFDKFKDDDQKQLKLQKFKQLFKQLKQLKQQKLNDASTIVSHSYSLLETLKPLHRMMRLAITTVILADFGYLLWDAGHKPWLPKVLDLYDKFAARSSITKSVEAVYKSFADHKSDDRLVEEMVKIALDHRLSPKLLKDPIVTENRD